MTLGKEWNCNVPSSTRPSVCSVTSHQHFLTENEKRLLCARPQGLLHVVDWPIGPGPLQGRWPDWKVDGDSAVDYPSTDDHHTTVHTALASFDTGWVQAHMIISFCIF